MTAAESICHHSCNIAGFALSCTLASAIATVVTSGSAAVIDIAARISLASSSRSARFRVCRSVGGDRADEAVVGTSPLQRIVVLAAAVSATPTTAGVRIDDGDFDMGRVGVSIVDYGGYINDGPNYYDGSTASNRTLLEMEKILLGGSAQRDDNERDNVFANRHRLVAQDVWGSPKSSTQWQARKRKQRDRRVSMDQKRAVYSVEAEASRSAHLAEVTRHLDEMSRFPHVEEMTTSAQPVTTFDVAADAQMAQSAGYAYQDTTDITTTLGQEAMGWESTDMTAMMNSWPSLAGSRSTADEIIAATKKLRTYEAKAEAMKKHLAAALGHLDPALAKPTLEALIPFLRPPPYRTPNPAPCPTPRPTPSSPPRPSRDADLVSLNSVLTRQVEQMAARAVEAAVVAPPAKE
eukprot:TRINITY_DN45220_c0_g1_i1.p1 TRINITY_DN45220_c0_g1~~TRINITY_DN45220_c0_g1_i1.p1  ORF type:complete len:407 (-),score=64.66 TRINITY_DN45220_c0_g1_i1:55-1275(-)